MTGDLKALRDMFAAFDQAMATEQVPTSVRKRVMNQLMFGNPHGDDAEVVELLDRDEARRHLFEGRLPIPKEADRG